jgi:plastocyanin
MRRIRLMMMVVAAFLAVGFAALGWMNGPSAGASASTTTKVVKMLDYKFSPKTITIAKGTKVKWKNDGNAVHDAKGSGFNSGPVAAGDSYTHTFNKTGTFSYVCTYHKNKGMTGKIVVQ